MKITTARDDDVFGSLSVTFDSKRDIVFGLLEKTLSDLSNS